MRCHEGEFSPLEMFSVIGKAKHYELPETAQTEVILGGEGRGAAAPFVTPDSRGHVSTDTCRKKVGQCRRGKTKVIAGKHFFVQLSFSAIHSEDMKPSVSHEYGRDENSSVRI